MKKIYFDYAATTPVDPAVFVAMKPYFSDKFGNAGSLHSFGQEAMAALDDSREKIAKAINTDFREVIFTGSATEANNLALRGVLGAVRNCFQKTPSISPARKSRLDRSASLSSHSSEPCPLSLRDTFSNNFLPPKVVVSSIEHESILETCRDLEKDGVEVIYLPVDKNGLVQLTALRENLDERTILVSVMYANNEIGTIQPIAEISEIIKKFREELRIKNNELSDNSQFTIHNSLFPLLHTDAVQAFQYLDFDVKKLGVDLMTLSAHKIYGPKGVGALYINSKLQNPNNKQIQNTNNQNSKNWNLGFSAWNLPSVSPLAVGGGQEYGLRSGTENIPGIAGFAKAVEIIDKDREREKDRIEGLRNYFWSELKKIFPKIQLNTPIGINQQYQHESASLPNNLNIYFPGHKAEDLLIKFDLAGIAVSAGSACSARGVEPSHVLKACGIPLERIKSSLRITLGKPTTKAEIKEAIRRIKRVISS
ncbi:MAG: cysteine desulfurase family protein [Candidatus Wolfebacteria bacterium]|nr:cysteine desulfurase family protein [Candidatus Wolfebacteria bacterium]